MTFIESDFPFKEIARFDTWKQANEAGYPDNRIWSVTSSDGDVWTYGPPHHIVNRLHYVVTNETHDGSTYYEESLYGDEDPETEDEDSLGW